MKLMISVSTAAVLAATPLMADIWHQDLDMDGYGNPEISVEADTQPLGFVPNDTDCDDTDIDIFQGCSLLLGNSQGTAAMAGLGALIVLGAAFGSGGSTNATTGTGMSR